MIFLVGLVALDPSSAAFESKYFQSNSVAPSSCEFIYLHAAALFYSHIPADVSLIIESNFSRH